MAAILKFLVLFLLFFVPCSASYHEQYREPYFHFQFHLPNPFAASDIDEKSEDRTQRLSKNAHHTHRAQNSSDCRCKKQKNVNCTKGMHRRNFSKRTPGRIVFCDFTGSKISCRASGAALNLSTNSIDPADNGSQVPQQSTQKWESYIFNEKEYIVQVLPVSWEDAKIICRGYHNGTLAILDTKDKAEFLAEALSESQFSLPSVWVGARRDSAEDAAGYRWGPGMELRRTALDVLTNEEEDDNVSRHFPMWLNRTHVPVPEMDAECVALERINHKLPVFLDLPCCLYLTYSFFLTQWLNRTHVPVPEMGADCVALERVNHDHPVFLDLPCYLERAFACERDAKESNIVKEVNTVRCRSGLYHLYDGKMDWHQAAAYCVLRGMALANIGTLKCLKKLGMTMLKNRPSIENAWVGAKGTLGLWKWIDTGVNVFQTPALTDASQDAWPPMRDRNNIKQNGCLQLDRHASHPPVFLEARCERKMQFICYEGSQKFPTETPSDDQYYYVLVRQLFYWQHANQNCLKMNGTLASLDSNDILIQLLLVMGENKEEPIEHIWTSGRLNMTKDISTDTVRFSWYNPNNGKTIPSPKADAPSTPGLYMPPWWIDEEFTMDNSCLNLDRQDHLIGLVYGLPCDTAQYSVCMIEKSRKLQPTIVQTPPPQPLSLPATVVTTLAPPSTNNLDGYESS